MIIDDDAANGTTGTAYVTYAGEPRTIQEALQSPNLKQWEKAIQMEYEQLKWTGTFEWVKNLPDGQKAVCSKIVLKEKHDGDGNIIKLKAQIVAKGFDQVPGQDYELTFASIAKFTTLRTLLSIVTHEDWELHQVDVVGAYLQGDLKEEIYMEVPEGVKEKGKSGWFWRLKKVLYGLKQAG